jgi:hypothetical protein
MNSYHETIIREQQAEIEKYKDILGRKLQELEALKDELSMAIVARNRAKDSRDHTTSWYAERHAALRDLAKEHGIWDKVACIMANGVPTITPYCPPTYAREMVRKQWRVNAAKLERDKAVSELASARDVITEALTGVWARGVDGSERWWVNMAACIKQIREELDIAKRYPNLSS